VDVDARKRNLARAHCLVAGEVRLAGLEQGDVGAGATHVERDEVALAEQAGCVPAPRDAPGRAGEHRAGGQAHRVRDGGHAAVRLHDQHVALITRLSQTRAQAAQVATQHRAHVGVHHGGAEALVLLDLREHVAGERHVGVRQQPREQLPGAALVARIAIGVQVTDRDRADSRGAQPTDRRLRRRMRERRLHRAVEPHPLGHVQPSRAGDQGHRRRHAQVVAVVLETLAHLDHVAVARGGQHADLRALALEQRVGGHRGAVHDEPGVGQEPRQVGAKLGGQQGETVHHADGRVGGGGGGLGQAHAPGVVDDDQVGEGAADVHAHAQHLRLSRGAASRRRSR
jgi:hypothetical protein